MRFSTKVYGDLAGFLDCFHSWFVILKFNFKFRSGGSNIPEFAFIAMNQINNMSGIARHSSSNHICFASSGVGKCFKADKETLGLTHSEIQDVNPTEFGNVLLKLRKHEKMSITNLYQHKFPSKKVISCPSVL